MVLWGLELCIQKALKTWWPDGGKRVGRLAVQSGSYRQGTHRHLDCLDTPSTHEVEGHDCMLQVLRKLEDQPLPRPYVISGLVTTLVRGGMRRVGADCRAR